MPIFAIVIAVAAFGLAVFAFVDRKDLEARLEALEKDAANWKQATLATLRNAITSVKADFGNRVQTLETRATALEKKTQTQVQATVNKAKTAVKGAVQTAKKRL